MTGAVMTLRNEWLRYESGLERDQIVVLDASGFVRRMGVQAGPYRYRDDGGAWRSHYFDIVVEGHDGGIDFYAVRPLGSRGYEALRIVLRRLRRDDPRLRNAGIHLVDRRNCPDWRVQRANATRRAWREPNPQADERLLGFLRRHRAPIRIDKSGRACGLAEGEAFASVARQLMTGVVELEEATTLVDRSLVRATPAN